MHARNSVSSYCGIRHWTDGTSYFQKKKRKKTHVCLQQVWSGIGKKKNQTKKTLIILSCRSMMKRETEERKISWQSTHTRTRRSHSIINDCEDCLIEIFRQQFASVTHRQECVTQLREQVNDDDEPIECANYLIKFGNVADGKTYKNTKGTTTEEHFHRKWHENDIRMEKILSENLPWRIVDESQFTKVIAFFECGNGATCMDHTIDRSFDQNVPWSSFVALIEHCGREESRNCELNSRAFKRKEFLFTSFTYLYR